jgi:hypothetical protein
LVIIRRNNNIATIICHLRRRAGKPNNSVHASAAPLVANQGIPRVLGSTIAALVAAVVEIVRVAVPAVVPVMLTGVVDPKLKVGGYWAPVGLEVMAAVSATAPVKPPAGDTVIVEVFPVDAPGVTVTAVPLIVKLGFTAVVIVTELDPVALL